MADDETFAFDSEFASFRDSILPQVTPAGPGVVRSTVRRRRRIAVTAAAVVALALIAGPVAGYAVLDRGHGTAPAPADSGEPNLPPTPTPIPSDTPTTTPSMPSGRIDRADLLAARLDLPAWPAGPSCPISGVRLIESEGGVGDTMLAGSTRGLRYGDVDGDGATETIALVECLTNDVGLSPQQVVAFDRDTSSRIVTLGQISRSNSERSEWFRWLDVRPDGSVRVEVWLNPPSDGSSPAPSDRQWRTYRWNGTRFVQTGGPASFPKPSAYPASLTMTATDLVYGPPDANGRRRGSMTVTITNTGAGEANHPMVTFPRSDRDEADHTLWSDCNPLIANPDSFRCLGEPLAPGAKRNLTFAFFTTVDAAPVEATVRVDPADAEGSALPDGGAQTTYLIKRGT